ncbi:nucleotidyl transferase AbiEii/AbiGii toxin family protein [Candidatus Azambacteria bacterium]|nr:nucleotidyl transferase AbiEii/AbiGii toxin family protein [Candidatus Azambacteria bacterium]
MHPETLNQETNDVFNLIKDCVPEFYLAGGTALALELGHRISVDLDFFCMDDFSTQDIRDRLIKKGTVEITSLSGDTFNGLLNGVRISFFKYPYKLLFPPIKYSGVNLADERDIAAMKILAISDRGSKKDFIDLFMLLKKYSLKEIFIFFNEKYQDYNYNTLHILKSLVYFFDADENPEPVYINPINWIEAKNFINDTVNKFLEE